MDNTKEKSMDKVSKWDEGQQRKERRGCWWKE